MKEKRIYYTRINPRLEFKLAVYFAVILTPIIFYQIVSNYSIEKSPLKILLASLGEVVMIWLIIYSNFTSKYKGPRIIIDTKSIQFIHLSPFLSVKKKVINYNEIKYLGTIREIDGKTENLSFTITLKNNKEHVFNIFSYDLTQQEIIDLVKEVNPLIELKSFGVHTNG